MKSTICYSILIVLLLSNCKTEPINKEGDFFFLRNLGADMPVWVRGKTSSNTFIIHLHGGPGGSGIDEGIEKAFYGLEADYAMVYWDQRASGNSQGKAKAESITIDQFVEDLNKLVVLIKNKYNNPKLFLMGHSWGGALGVAYLINENYQKNISGWIEIDGAHNFKKSLELSRQWVIDFAKKSIAEGKDKSYWEEALKWYETNKVLSNGNQLKSHSDNYLLKANGYIYDPNNPNLAKFSQVKTKSPSGLGTGNFVQEKLEIELSKGYSEKMGLIKIPALIINGRHDGIVPFQMADDAIKSLGTQSNKKEKVIFENSAHSPNREEPELFILTVKTFLEKYK